MVRDVPHQLLRIGRSQRQPVPDPVTLKELDAAVARVAKPVAQRRFFANLSLGLYDESYDAGLVIIDLISHGWSLWIRPPRPAPKSSSITMDNVARRPAALYHLADDWLISSNSGEWRGMAEERRRERLAKSILDARAVFYGRPMLEFLAKEALAAFTRARKDCRRGSTNPCGLAADATRRPRRCLSARRSHSHGTVTSRGTYKTAANNGRGSASAARRGWTSHLTLINTPASARMSW